MNKVIAVLLAGVLLMAASCSDDDNPTNSGGGTPAPNNTATSTWDTAAAKWTSIVDASSYDLYMGFSFTTRDTITGGVPKIQAAIWDIAFQRDAVKLNGGASSDNGGDVVAADLGEVTFADVTIDDTAGASWESDAVEYLINDWYDYNPVTHQLSANRNVWAMIDAEGDNYVKFQVDSMVGAGMPPDMGTVYLTYYYQPNADDRNLNGTTVSTSFAVGSNKTYFDFSTGTTVTPADPMNSSDWDIFFYSYDIGQNCGPNGSGSCASFPAYTELTADPTDIDAYLVQPQAPMFPDIAASALTGWYTYTGPPAHQLLSNNHVYLIETGGSFYKLQIISYYQNVGGVPTSGWYSFDWAEL